MTILDTARPTTATPPGFSPAGAAYMAACFSFLGRGGAPGQIHDLGRDLAFGDWMTVAEVAELADRLGDVEPITLPSPDFVDYCRACGVDPVTGL